MKTSISPRQVSSGH